MSVNVNGLDPQEELPTKETVKQVAFVLLIFLAYCGLAFGLAAYGEQIKSWLWR